MKTVFMLVNYTPSDSSIGITKKIGSELQAMRRMGMAVTYTAYDGDGVSVFDNQDTVVFHRKFPFSVGFINRKIRYYWLEKVALDYLKQSEGFDLGYLRIGVPNGIFFRICDVLKRKGAKLVGESHAYFPGIQYKSLIGKYIMAMYRLHSRQFPQYLSCFLVEGDLKEMHGVKAYAMNIGVETGKIAPHTYVGDATSLNMISVANENIYHGYDRLLMSLWTYKQKNPEAQVFIHLVGTISEKTKQMIEKYQLEKSVILYGKRSGAELDEIYNKCNVGLGPFGQHRVGGKKDTGLKTKEYFAKGLPYIYSGSEPTVPEDYPYICNFPSDESMVDFDLVWKFYESYRNDPQVVQRMRDFAQAHYSWDTIMSEALSHLEQ